MGMSPKEALARVLRSEKAKAQLTDDQIAQAAGGGLTERIVGRVMRGDQEPKIGQLALIAQGIGVSMADIVYATEVEIELAVGPVEDITVGDAAASSRKATPAPKSGP